MTEDRKYPRTAVDHPARICSDGISIDCNVVNISANGAAIDVSNVRHVPDRFQLVTEHGRVVLNCRIVWIKQNRIGVAFE
jgi:hypothetical protein